MRLFSLFLTFSFSVLCEVPPCVPNPHPDTFAVHHIPGNPELSADPSAVLWKGAAQDSIVKDCTHQIDYPDLRTTVSGVWSDTHLYLLFQCPFSELNVFLPADNKNERVGLWDKDVVEMFLGDDWDDIRHYREFEIAPTGDWIDLAIDLNRNSYDHSWNSGWRTMAHIDKGQKIWYAAAEIPLSSVTEKTVSPGSKWRANLYRIDGLGPDSQRRFLCWQPTCVQKRDANHVPERFGTLLFAR